MQLETLSLVDFKNIASATLRFGAGLNCLVGENGAGKTNVLDAIHYLSMCRSSLGTTDRQSVRHGAEFFVVEGGYVADGGYGVGVVCSFSGSAGKKIRANDKEYERFSDHLGAVPLVMVSPADSYLISDAADERRRWLNSFISQLDRGYLQALVRYNGVLVERNRLLKEGVSPVSAEVLDALDVQLVRHGEVVFSRREQIVGQLAPLVADFYARLSDDREAVELSYRSELSGGAFGDVLAASRQKDFALGFTSSGVHRDDLVMRIGGHPLRRYGSQGQQKSFLVALKLAQGVVSTEVMGERPILLLDDLFDKLDGGRVGRLLELVSCEPFGQIFVSDCNKPRLAEILARSGKEYVLFEIDNGELSQESSVRSQESGYATQKPATYVAPKTHNS